MIDVMIVAEARLYREGLAQALGTAGHFRVVASAARPSQLDAELASCPEAVVLLDVTRSGTASLSGLRNRWPSHRVVAFGVPDDVGEIVAYAEAGVSGYVTLEGSLAELLATLDGVAQDEVPCSPRIAAALIRRVATLAGTSRPELNVRLSRRELEILSLVEEGLSNKQIARRLYITVATVKNHVHSILGKLEVRSRTDAAAWIRTRSVSCEVELRPFANSAHQPVARAGRS
jgi:DNA-binding NarL/FixJ family response regulator